MTSRRALLISSLSTVVLAFTGTSAAVATFDHWRRPPISRCAPAPTVPPVVTLPVEPVPPVVGAPSAEVGTTLTAYVTGYSWYDNDPPGSTATASGKAAGGTGTYADPITMATAKGKYAFGTIFYFPYLKKYFVVEDTCASCGARTNWLDVWVDGRNSGEAAANAAMNRLTGNHEVILNPAKNLPVSTTKLA